MDGSNATNSGGGSGGGGGGMSSLKFWLVICMLAAMLLFAIYLAVKKCLSPVPVDPAKKCLSPVPIAPAGPAQPSSVARLGHGLHAANEALQFLRSCRDDNNLRKMYQPIPRLEPNSAKRFIDAFQTNISPSNLVKYGIGVKPSFGIVYVLATDEGLTFV